MIGPLLVVDRNFVTVGEDCRRRDDHRCQGGQGGKALQQELEKTQPPPTEDLAATAAEPSERLLGRQIEPEIEFTQPSVKAAFPAAQEAIHRRPPST